MMRSLFRFPCVAAATLALLPTAAFAQGAPAAAPAAAPVNWHAVMMFLMFVAITLYITYWAATHTKTATDFYAAGRGITGAAERPRDRRRLHVGGLVPRHRRAGLLQRLLRPESSRSAGWSAGRSSCS